MKTEAQVYQAYQTYNRSSKYNQFLLNTFFLLQYISLLLVLVVLTGIFFLQNIFAQQFNQPQYYAPQQQNRNMVTSNVFRQEIARFQITVTREGKEPLPITQVPRVQQGDILKVKLLDEAINGIKLDQSQWDWTFLITFINPSRRLSDTSDRKAFDGLSGDKTGTVSEEIQFRKKGWYKEYSFTVPYDSQPVFFLYPRPKYRKQLMKVVGSKYEEIRKLGEKTIELAGAYSQINTFLNELQFVLNRNAQQYGFTYNGNATSGSTYNPYAPYTTPNPQNNGGNVPVFGLPMIPMLNHLVEGLAKSFNIQLPSCWGNGSSYGGNYGSYGSTGVYNSGTSAYGTYGGYGNYGNTPMMDFVNRAQCVAKNVSLEQFDVSVTRMWQQGGVFLVAELQRKYPQIAYWINIAAAAIDFIVKVFQKAPLRIVPTVIQSNEGSLGSYASPVSSASYQSNYNQFSSGGNYSPNSGISGNSQTSNQGKISLFADSQPNEGQFVTAYPIVVHKWQANPDPEIISLYPPVLAEPCLHPGTNVLKSVELSNQLTEDPYSKDFKLVMTSNNGFRKEFPLRKNVGLSGWELNLTAEDMNQIPKIQMTLEAELVGIRGFNEIKSPKFELPIPVGGSWEITPESSKQFTVGGKRTLTIRNTTGNCRCLQRIIYKPSFGGQFVFEPGNPANPNSLQFSSDGKEVSFEVDTTTFQPGPGTIEIKTFGGETASNQQFSQSLQNQFQAPNQAPGNNISIKLYPAPPIISDVKARRGDKEILLTGDRLNQIQSLTINGKRAIVKGKKSEAERGGQNLYNVQKQAYPNQPNQSSSPNQMGNQTQTSNLPVSLSQNFPPQTISQYQNISPNQLIAVFEESNVRITSESILLELILEDNRPLTYPTKFSVGSSRPAIKANEQNEIEGIFLREKEQVLRDEVVIQNSMVIVNGLKGENQKKPVKNQASKIIEQRPQIDLTNYPIVLIDRSEMTLAVQNVLTDYNFRLENLSIETNIESATTNPAQLPLVNFEVLDTNNLRLNFSFNQTTNKYLSGRRLQFRIRDKERGDSDWYTIRQTFVRIPNIESVKCTSQNSANNNPNTQNTVNSVFCELRGEGLDYIAQVSVDGGRNWTNTLQVEPTAEGNLLMKIPHLINQKFLQIKLRDYPNTEGLSVTNFIYSNSVKKMVAPLKKTDIKTPSANNPAINQGNNLPNGQVPNPPIQSNQMNQPIQNQPNSQKSKKPIPRKKTEKF